MRKRSFRKKRRSGALYFRLFLCMAIICSAVVLKHINLPVVAKFAQTMNDELKIDGAVEAVSGIFDKNKEVEEVFAEEDFEPLFGEDYYKNSRTDEIKKELEKAREEAEKEEKRQSVETLSFQMSEEELCDNTKAELFRIPPPSYCSYDKPDIGFKFKTPLFGVITSRFGYRDHPLMEDASFHTGLDIAAKSGTAVGAFAGGTVVEAGKNSTYGNYLLIEHSGGIRSFYGHNSKLSVKKGQKVKLGQKVAEVGSTGISTGPHLHFEVRKGNIRLDPALYIGAEIV